ncbi:MAG: HAD-IB family phosphatase [Promethearchaeota archaeon]
MNQKEKIISLSAIGLDSPGLVARITSRVFELGGNIIDVEENCRHGLFSIFLVIDFSGSGHDLGVIEAGLKRLEGETGLQLLLAAYSKEDIEYLSEKEDHVVTILGVDRPGIIAKVSSFFAERNINIESCRMIARGKFFSMEMVIDTSRMRFDLGEGGDVALDKMKDELKGLCISLDQSVVIQSENIFMKAKKLVVFDVESTLIQESSIREFIKRVFKRLPSRIEDAGSVSDAVKKPMDSLVDHARLLKGISIKELERLSDILTLNPGTRELIQILKSMGFKIALLSSGFNFLFKKIFESAGVDYAFSNTLKVDENGILTGELDEPIINDTTKNEILEFIMNVENITRDQVIAVGDGSTRSHFMKNVGLSIAFKPEERITKADGIIKNDDLISLLYCMGLSKSELEKIMKKEPVED